MSPDAQRRPTRPKMSIRTRMSLWFTLVLAIICALMLAAVATAYSSYGKQAARAELIEAVRAEAEAIEQEHGYEDRLATGKLSDSDFAKGDVQLMVYGEGGKRYAGLFLHGELDEVAFSPSEIPQEVELDGNAYYYYDERVRIRHGDDYWVRGITRVEMPVWDMLTRSGFLTVLVPALLLIAFLGGRLLAGRLMRPVREVDRTMREIRESGDLARRVPVSSAGDELSALASDMNEMLDSLERNFEAERTFASNASHELRTPVAVILAECEYAEDDATSKEELRESIAAVQKQGRKMSEIIDALLMLTRMDQRTERYAREPLDLSALVNGMCDDLSRECSDAHVKSDVAQDVTALANRDLVGLALSNLLRNAVRYGGESATIDVSLAIVDDRARISVSDDGPGIADNDLERIWELFYRADASRSSEGLGLGLPLVKRIAEYHGGSATVESEAGRGATFTIELPLASSDHAGHAGHAGRAGHIERD